MPATTTSMTPFQKHLTMAILASASPIYLKTLSQYSGVNREELVEFLREFKMPEPLPEGISGETKIQLYLSETYEYLRGHDVPNVESGFPVPTHLLVALRMLNGYPPGYTYDRGREYLSIIASLLQTSHDRLSITEGSYRSYKQRELIALVMDFKKVVALLRESQELEQKWNQYRSEIEGKIWTLSDFRMVPNSRRVVDLLKGLLLPRTL